jgi:hypothetical protein
MACKLSPVQDSSDFQGQAGDKVTIATKDHIGVVLMAKAEYDGKQLIQDRQAVSEIQLTIASGAKSLKIVFVFSASIAGRGELREDASPDSQFLRDVAGDEPFQLVRIVGR